MSVFDLVISVSLWIFNRMNFTSGEKNVTVTYQETFVTAVVMNLIVVVLCISINYINATMVHTFNKHHVCFCLLTLKVICKCTRSTGSSFKSHN